MLVSILADSPQPTFDVGWALLVVIRVLHITCAAAIFGGLVYIHQMVAPLTEGADDPAEALYRGRRSAWAKVVMMATAFLILSGFLQYYYNMTGHEDLPPLYHALFGIKFLLAFFVFYVAAGTAGKSALASDMQKNITKWVKLGIAAVLVIFVLAAVMRTFPKVPLAAEAAPAAAADEKASPDNNDTPITEENSETNDG
ncbi:hypothetical protein [Aeoliella mucimassa]|uniref:Copper resistance protein D n=1 Tax=Aeoliella mucimassa TaxID=2527972 RepID=A0A518ARV3_9BACT|nr:hypothetical protein [Aeoliella mucimassa]QDU57450.1 hypothetical protein Pan181_36660 [Aeoliella mucimassa]